MKRGDYVRLPDGRVGVYSTTDGGEYSLVIMPDWSMECVLSDKLELIGAKKDLNTASSGVWIFTDKWYKTQSQWEGGYFVEGKWVSLKEVKKVKRIDDIRAWMPAGLNNTYEEFVQFLVETAVGVSDPKEFDNTFTNIQKSLFEQPNLTACNEPLNSSQIEEKETGKKWGDNTTPKFNPGDRVFTPYWEGVVYHVTDGKLYVKHDNGYWSLVDAWDVKLVEEKITPEWEDTFLDYWEEKMKTEREKDKVDAAGYAMVGGLMWRTGEGDLSVVLNLIADYETIRVQFLGQIDIEKSIAKKLLEKYTIQRK